jgi:hypothetical protein
MRVAIALRAHRPGANVPRPEFVAALHRRLADELSGWAGVVATSVDVSTGRVAGFGCPVPRSGRSGTGPSAVDA